jgi:chemotaxis protein methyltransferase CheR
MMARRLPHTPLSVWSLPPIGGHEWSHPLGGSPGVSPPAAMVLPSEAPLTAQAYDFLANLVYEHSRIRLGPDRQSLVAGRLRQRLLALGLETYDDYCLLLKSPQGADEVDALIDLISTNHTHFFREPSHFDLLSQQILPRLAEKSIAGMRPLRFWCAACSSGEEVYSLAIVLAEFSRLRPAVHWQIEASDISQRMLERCQQGIYDADKVSVPQPEWLERYFLRGIGEREGYYRVKNELRRQVTVRYVNLFQDVYPVPRGLDVIFCRNVMIYFDVPSRNTLIERLTDQLAPGGILFVGHSESLIGLHHGLRTIAPSVYMRPE